MDPAAAASPTKTRRQRKREIKSAIALAAAPEIGPRRSRCEVRKVDLWSVLKVSLCFYLAGVAVLVVALIVLWLIADVAGLIHNVEKFVGQVLGTKNYRLVSAQLLEGALLVGIVMVVLLVTVTVTAAAFYNLFSEMVGGAEITLVESRD